jgi:hypothetical protein
LRESSLGRTFPGEKKEKESERLFVIVYRIKDSGNIVTGRKGKAGKYAQGMQPQNCQNNE